MNTDQRLQRLESVVTSLIDYINKYNINTLRRDYNTFLKREEASHRHKLRFDYTVGALVQPNICGENEQAEDEIDGSTTCAHTDT